MFCSGSIAATSQIRPCNPEGSVTHTGSSRLTRSMHMLSLGAASLRGVARHIWLVPLVLPLTCCLRGACARSRKHLESVPAIRGADSPSSCSAHHCDGKASTTLTAACCAARPCPQALRDNHSSRPDRPSSLTGFTTTADRFLALGALAGPLAGLFAAAPLGLCSRVVGWRCAAPLRIAWLRIARHRG